MFYTIYKITNKLNRKIYIGKHKTKNLNDGYMGSGKLITNAIKKHGIENFEKEILFILDSEKEMNHKEQELITEEFCKRDDTYNLAIGDQGGPHFKGKKHTLESRIKMSKKVKASKSWVYTEEYRKKLSDNNFSKKDPERQREHARRIARLNKSPKGKMPEETKRKISKSLKGKKSPIKGIIREKIKCPYCDKVGANNTMSRWHFENCKFKLS